MSWDNEPDEQTVEEAQAEMATFESMATHYGQSNDAWSESDED